MSDSGRDGGALRIDPSLCTPGGIAPGKWKERTPHPSCTMLREGRELKRCTLSVSLAIAEALRLANVGIICSYPITFQNPVVEFLSEYCAGHRARTRFLHLKNERSAIAAFTGAASTGIRTFTLACDGIQSLMNELSDWESTIGFPVVIAEIRGGMMPFPFVRGTQRDLASLKPMGWLRLSCENNQEVLDTILQAYCLEALVNLPVTVVLDDSCHSYDNESVEIPEQRTVNQFLGQSESPRGGTVRPLRTGRSRSMPAGFRGRRPAVTGTTENVQARFLEVEENFEHYFHRRYGVVEAVHCDDAEIIVVTTGTASRAGREVIHSLRKRGEKAGLLKIKLLRPFPADSVRNAIGSAKKIAVVDRDLSFGSRDLLAREVAAALEGVPELPSVFKYIAGMDGCDITADTMEEIYDMTKRRAAPQEESAWIGPHGFSMKDTA
ncbi:MAG: pyruvate ferredoxin oxidoreductase [Deltaproteobacteria bacterium]|nr:pyruvate ferredoxin oxidoreductase [Deltaproteobacteria bacterium]